MHGTWSVFWTEHQLCWLTEWMNCWEPWEANQEIFGILCNPKPCYYIHKSPQTVPVLHKKNTVSALQCYLCWKYIKVGTAMSRAPQLFLIFCATFCFGIQQPCTLNKMHYSAVRVTWFQEMMGQVPKPWYCQCLKVTKNKCGCFSCLAASLTPRTASQPHE
jgi:hypothetical protein